MLDSKKEEPIMTHGAATDWGTDKTRVFKSRLGIILFFIYLIIYIVFILLNAIDIKFMETIVFAGLNLAIIYGFGLIILAIVLGLAYNFICTAQENKHKTSKEENT